LRFSTPDRHLKSSAGREGADQFLRLAGWCRWSCFPRDRRGRTDQLAGWPVALPGGQCIEVNPDFDTNTFERLPKCTGAGVGRVWTWFSHTDLSGCRGHRQCERGRTVGWTFSRVALISIPTVIRYLHSGIFGLRFDGGSGKKNSSESLGGVTSIRSCSSLLGTEPERRLCRRWQHIRPRFARSCPLAHHGSKVKLANRIPGEGLRF
jgi:hypothetical protein